MVITNGIWSLGQSYVASRGHMRFPTVKKKMVPGSFLFWCLVFKWCSEWLPGGIKVVAWVVKSGFLWWSKVATLVVKSGRPGGQKWSPGGGNKWLVPSGCHTSGQFSRHSVAWMMSIKMWWFLGMVVVSWWLQSPGSYRVHLVKSVE